MTGVGWVLVFVAFSSVTPTVRLSVPAMAVRCGLARSVSGLELSALNPAVAVWNDPRNGARGCSADIRATVATLRPGTYRVWLTLVDARRLDTPGTFDQAVPNDPHWQVFVRDAAPMPAPGAMTVRSQARERLGSPAVHVNRKGIPGAAGGPRH